MKQKDNSVWYMFFQSTSVSITNLFEDYKLRMMDSKAQSVPNTPNVCVALWSQHLLSF